MMAREDLSGPGPEVARVLLGSLLVSDTGPGEPVTLRLTEVEAYAGPADPASHAARGRTARTRVMFGPAGHAYVYLSYGIHWCLNVVCGPDGTASAVLLRAAAVIGGLPTARARRPGVTDEARLARGPGVLTLAAGVTGALTGSDLCAPDAVLTLRRGQPPARIMSGPRVGVSAAAEVPWRFWEPDQPSVSTYRRSPRAPLPP